MSTSIYISSSQRFDEEKQIVSKDNVSPFKFKLTQSITSAWNFERRPFSRTAIAKATDSFQIEVCKVLVPKNLMPNQQPILQLQIEQPGDPTVNRAIGPNIKNTNIYALGATGLTGVPQSCISCGVTNSTVGNGTCCVKSYYSLGLTGLAPVCIPSSGLNSFNETWPLYPSDNPGTATHWMYDSCALMAINHDWKNAQLTITLRDQAGYVVLPDTFTESQLCAFNPCLVTSRFAPLFVLENQLLILLKATYVENDALSLDKCR